jgi:hypothetical protein
MTACEDVGNRRQVWRAVRQDNAQAAEGENRRRLWHCSNNFCPRLYQSLILKTFSENSDRLDLKMLLICAGSFLSRGHFSYVVR